jgi:hypothetical protein
MNPFPVLGNQKWLRITKFLSRKRTVDFSRSSVTHDICDAAVEANICLYKLLQQTLLQIRATFQHEVDRKTQM